MTRSSGRAYVVPEAFAVMGVDPGGKSGVAQGVFRPWPAETPTVKATLRRAVRKGVVRASVIDGAPEEQAHFLARIWRDFKFKTTVEWGVSERYVFLAIENFQLRQMAVDLSPVEVVSGLRTLQHVPVTNGWFDDVAPENLMRPNSSESMTFATNDRMKLWNVYALGRGRGYGDHARDALRQVCLGVNKVLEGKWPTEVAS